MPTMALMLSALLAGSSAGTLQPLGGATAPRWTPCLSWVTNAPVTYAVTEEDGNLVFTAEGAGTELPWLIRLNEDEATGDRRYLILRYRATGLLQTPGNYFVHGEEGSVGGLNYAFGEEVRSDGEWHTLGMDLPAIDPRGPTHAIALKVRVDQGGKGRLEVERLWFADELPNGAGVARVREREEVSVTLAWARSGLPRPMDGWTSKPATEHRVAAVEGGAQFAVAGAGRGMRWHTALPEPVDLSGAHLMSLRYRVAGTPAATGYAIWLGTSASGTGGRSSIAMPARDLIADGRWHTVTLDVRQDYTATEIAFGLDCESEQATMTLGDITFSSRPPLWPLADLLPHTASDAPWPAGHDGLTPLQAPMAGGAPSVFARRRLELADWFSSRHVTVAGVPFAVPESLEAVPFSGTAEKATLHMELPPDVKEIYLLTAATAPATEPFGIFANSPRPQHILDVPEKVVCEIRYEQGPPDFMLPVEVVSGRWGVKRGLGVHVVHPAPGRRPTMLLWHDRMQTTGFAVPAVTLSTAEPMVAEPSWEHLNYPPPPPGALRAAAAASVPEEVVRSGALVARLSTQRGLTWEQLGVAGAPGLLSCAPGPVFEVTVAGRRLPAEEWVAESAQQVEGGMRHTLGHAGAGLQAVVDCLPGGGNELLLRMELRNVGQTPLTATLRFPVLSGVSIGGAADTWYLCGKRGGIINSEPVSFREPLGERHPLQMDGFFGPRSAVALACLTHDTVAQHHFVRFAKDESGGAWSPEYVERDLARGASFQATEAALVLREGDWRAIFSAYQDWLATWFSPAVPRPEFFQSVFAFLGCNVHHEVIEDPGARGAIQPHIDLALKYLGVCDYVHLYGWAASPTYGEWGDYNHYDETVGGQDYFRSNIARARESKVGVGLYTDAYLSCEKGRFAGGQAREWAMKRPDGSANYVPQYDAFNQCPYMVGWQDYYSKTLGRIHRDLAPTGIYVDEYGATDGRWTCYAKDHGHNGYEIPYAGEVETLRKVREAVGPDVALYCEYPPAEVSRRYLDGSFIYQAVWSVDQEPLAPHFIDLPRFAFPDFKQFHLLSYVRPWAGNWWTYKFPLFNGESYDISEPGLPHMERAALQFQKHAVQVLCAHRAAFSSDHVEPLVATEQAGVFCNRFAASDETVWTLYNANGRTVRGVLLKVAHRRGAKYRDAWGERDLWPQVDGDTAALELELGPKAVGCVVQEHP